MITLKKTPGKDFIILNLTDPQLGNKEWAEDHVNGRILKYTLEKLVEKTKPDLITVSGDIAWAGHDFAYDSFAKFMDSLQIPWAPVWGNHDNQGGTEAIDAVVERFMDAEYCIYEKGDAALGNGNYVIAVEEDGMIVEGIIMMDSHDKLPYVGEDGTEKKVWAKLNDEQIEWYRSEVGNLKKLGCRDTMMVMHIPIYAYFTAFQAAFDFQYNNREVTLEDSYNGKCWKEDYKDSYGVAYEKGDIVFSYPEDDHVFDVVKELGSTKHIVSGHDHINNFVISYEGVKFIYGLKLGAGCYWNEKLNGGTYFRVTSDGVSETWHEYVDASPVMNVGEEK